MTSRNGQGFLANVASNLAVGAAALGYAVIVPAVVVRRFGAEVYGNWYLAFQVAAYIVLLDLGSQYLVTNEASTPASAEGPARLTTAAMAIQSALAVAVLAGTATWALLTDQAELAQLIVVLGLAGVASLMASTVRAWFVGLRRAHVPAVWLGSQDRFHCGPGRSCGARCRTPATHRRGDGPAVGGSRRTSRLGPSSTDAVGAA